jgi:PAS domain S-box-containing protein
LLNYVAMRAPSIAIVSRNARPVPSIGRPRRASLDALVARFSTELSPAHGQRFFDRLVEFVAESFGVTAVVVGEFISGGARRLVPLAEYPTPAAPGQPADFEVALVGSDGRQIGAIRGFGSSQLTDERTMKMLVRIIAHRAAAELERLRLQRELSRRDALFLGLISETHDVVGIVDAAGAFTAVSPAIERVLGFCPETCNGLPVIELVHPVDRESVAALLRIGGPQGYAVEARLRRSDGNWATMAVTVVEHQDADGRMIKVLSARDLTDRRQLEDRLRQAQKTEMIGRLATGIAHDFGNILMVVRSHADVMGLRTTPDDPSQSSVDAIQQAVTRGAELARQLLAFSRHRQFELRRIDINASIEQMATLLRRVVGSNIRLETDLSPDARYVAADPTQFEQIILNLTLNARDAMPNGGAITFVTSAAAGPGLPRAVAAAPGDYLCFSVRDTGCGIRDDVKPHIFEPLFTTKQDGAGSGIGLATVHEIVTRHGGLIEVASAEGQGAAFRVYLRRTHAPARKARAAV